jgi:hypothetical protein
VEPQAPGPDPLEPPAAEPSPVEPPAAEREPQPAEPAPHPSGLASDEARAALDSMLDSLGSAHHRPYSRG